MIFEVSKAYIEKKYKTKIWDYLKIHRAYWSQMKSKKKMGLIYYKRICESCEIDICVDDKKIIRKMINDYYE